MADESTNPPPPAIVTLQTPTGDVPPSVPDKGPPSHPPSSESPEFIFVTEKETPHPPPPPPPSHESKQELIEPEIPNPTPEPKKVPRSLVSFKEESNRVADLSDSERAALDELKQLVQAAISSHEFDFPVAPQPKADEPQTSTQETEIKVAASASPDEVSIWGVPLLADERSDVMLLKFLRARDFKPKDAFAMLKDTIRWRKTFSIDALVDEDLGDDLEKVVFMHGSDKEGHPVCYNVYGEFQNKELYQKTFADEEKRMKFLRWRIQFLERSIRKLDFSPGGICTIFQVSDLKNSPGPAKRELRLATRQALMLLQDNYPEFVAKQVFINVPWWYLAFYTMISPFLTQRTKSKFVFASPAKTAETLFKYITPEQVPIRYGGLSVDFCECNPEFTDDDPASEVTVKPSTKQTVEIIVNEKCIIVWELRVVGWEVSYGAEYVPNTEGGYTIIIHKARKFTANDEPVVSNSFKISELGKILLTVDNPTAKKKKLLYRFKVKPLCD
ncbi:hypothetical protein RJ639_017558 [Escallonia herrerae]|uniref:Patellin-3 n=1 Tax=Escallonia herrerae TaxID=1293975 RepID=A0AA88VCQ7_9ASTE|nr:hypothetical protein RJ639_025280 [Escallonia herrerae]KAK3005809.1 hypothetical protein RJ639_017558 [Escallonia herrerae]